MRRVMTSHDNKLRSLQRMKEELRKAESDTRHAGVREGSSCICWVAADLLSFFGEQTPQEHVYRLQVERFKKETERRQAELFAMETQLLDPKIVGMLIGFYNFAMAWLVRVVDPKHEHPNRTVSLPLPEETPPAFAMLPEYLLEDIAEFFVFVSRSVGICCVFLSFE
jgi:hypothetical protein